MTASTELTLDRLSIEDERSFRHVPLYASLKSVLLASGYRFRVLPPSRPPRWDRALFLNLTFWGASGDGDVLPSRTIVADVVAHVAWHHLAAKALVARRAAPLSAEGLFFGEAIASAFDLYLVGRLLGHASRSSFLDTQVPAMAEAAQAAGLSAAKFEALLAGVARDPAGAFEDLRALLFDAAVELLACKDVASAERTLTRLERHRFGSLLHRYELSNWILYARAHATHATDALGRDAKVRTIDRALRDASVSLDWLDGEWVKPALTASAGSGARRTPSRRR